MSTAPSFTVIHSFGSGIGSSYDEGMSEILSWVAIGLSVASLGWTIFITVRLNDTHFTIAPAPVVQLSADGRPPVSLLLTSVGGSLVRDVRLSVNADPMNHSLLLTDRRWHSIAGNASVRTTATGVTWHGAAAPGSPWDQRFYGEGKTVEDRLVTVSWKNVLGIRRRQEIELPMIGVEPEYSNERLRALTDNLRAENS
jgi:hypothetical protein